MKVKKFNAAEDAELWNNFVDKGKNSSFLFHRQFMDYHADRFTDYSLLVFNAEEQLVALLPANVTGSELISHQGLTYGGIVMVQDVKLGTVIAIFYQILKFLQEQQITFLNMKLFPSFYNIHPTDEVEYCLFLLEAALYRRDVTLTIDMQHRIPYTGNIRREANKAAKAGAVLVEEVSFDGFWNDVLTPNLQERFGVKPVHSLAEITLLNSRFPEKIKQYNVYLDGKIAAGTTLFITHKVVHCQYISSNDFGRKAGCLNYLFKCLLDEVYPEKRFFDFGIVNENGGREINRGMLFWKESFGCRAQKHDFYKINTAHHQILTPYI